jgi:hypothetical protein
MTPIKTSIVALALAASSGALASSASAQTSRADRIAAAREARADVQTHSRTHQGVVRGAPVYAVPSQTGSPGCYSDGNYGQGVDESACNQ